jgi:uncharacterized membrane protein YgcG
MSERSDDSLAASADLGSLLARARRLGEGAYAMAQAELRKLRHDYLDIFTRMVQPLLWLFVFGTAMRHVRKLGVAGVDYRSYLVPGVMAQSALFVAHHDQRCVNGTNLVPDGANRRIGQPQQPVSE